MTISYQSDLVKSMFFSPIHLVVRVSAESKEYKVFGFLIIPRWKSATSWPIGVHCNTFIKRVKYRPTGKNIFMFGRSFEIDYWKYQFEFFYVGWILIFGNLHNLTWTEMWIFLFIHFKAKCIFQAYDKDIAILPKIIWEKIREYWNYCS